MKSLSHLNPYNYIMQSFLYDLLKERTPEQSISHRGMPTFAQHVEFLKSRPYKVWYLIEEDGVWLGSIYLTHQNEIGIFLMEGNRGKGVGKWALEELMRLHPSDRYLANVNPNNEASRRFFESKGFDQIQATYELRRK